MSNKYQKPIKKAKLAYTFIEPMTGLPFKRKTFDGEIMLR